MTVPVKVWVPVASWAAVCPACPCAEPVWPWVAGGVAWSGVCRDGVVWSGVDCEGAVCPVWSDDPCDGICDDGACVLGAGACELGVSEVAGGACDVGCCVLGVVWAAETRAAEMIIPNSMVRVANNEIWGRVFTNSSVRPRACSAKAQQASCRNLQLSRVHLRVAFVPSLAFNHLR